MRLAWFSPWPPARGDAAERSAAVVPALRARGFDVDVISRTADAADRPPKDHQLSVYHLADAPEHDFMWPDVFRRPGLVVFHDGRLHRARRRVLLGESRAADYRAEFAWNHPHVAPAIAELGVRGHEGAYGAQWPMTSAIIAASRLSVTHAPGAVALLHADQPDHPVDYIPASNGSPIPPQSVEEVRARFRAAVGWPQTAIVLAVFGPLGLERRVPQILRAFAAVRPRIPEARVLLAGPRDPDLDLPALVHELGLDDLVRVIADGAELEAAGGSVDAVAAAADVVLALRWPAALDMPGWWLRALAAGRATVILDLVHMANVPALDPRTWRRHAPSDRSTAADASAVTVAIDVMDEDHSLRLALQRLGADAELRQRLGQAGRAYWEAEHSPDRMVEGYVRAIRHAIALPQPRVSLPAHLQPS